MIHASGEGSGLESGSRVPDGGFRADTGWVVVHGCRAGSHEDISLESLGVMIDSGPW